MGFITDFADKKDLTLVKKAVREKGVDAVKNAKDLKKNSILHIACSNMDHDMIDYSIDIGVNINAPNVAGDSPLILSAKKGDIEAVKKLISAGSKVNHFNTHGNTALHYACFWRYAEVALYLTKVAEGYVKIANHYGALPLDHTSKKLHAVLSEIAKSQGDQTIRAQSLEDINEKKHADITAINDWAVEADEIQVGDPINTTEFANTFSAIFRTTKSIVKVPNLEHELDEEEVGVIKKEIGAIRKCQQANLVNILCACTESPDVCYVLAWEDGGNLMTLLADSSKWLSITDAMGYALQVCKAVTYLHETKPEFMVHGNLKTSNILILKDGKLALSDFGFSKSIFHPLNGDSIKLRFNAIEWFPPELLSGRHDPSDLRSSDVYSFGMVLYSIMTRQPIFPITNEMVLGYMIAVDGLVPSVPDYIPATLTSVMMKCWQYEPSTRPPIRQVYQDLLKLKF